MTVEIITGASDESDLLVTLPPDTDYFREGAAHIRNIKQVLNNLFNNGVAVDSEKLGALAPAGYLRLATTGTMTADQILANDVAIQAKVAAGTIYDVATMSATDVFTIGNVATALRLNALGNPTINGNTIWHSGNDGVGSGLDANLIDGLTSGQLIRSDVADTFTGKLTGEKGTGAADFMAYKCTDSTNELQISKNADGTQMKISPAPLGIPDTNTELVYDFATGEWNFAGRNAFPDEPKVVVIEEWTPTAVSSKNFTHDFSLYSSVFMIFRSIRGTTDGGYLPCRLGYNSGSTIISATNTYSDGSVSGNIMYVVTSMGSNSSEGFNGRADFHGLGNGVAGTAVMSVRNASKNQNGAIIAWEKTYGCPSSSGVVIDTIQLFHSSGTFEVLSNSKITLYGVLK